MFADARCLACGANAKAELARLEHAIHDGICAVCGADPAQQDRPAASSAIIPVHAIEKRMLERAEIAMEKARIERSACDDEDKVLSQQARDLNDELDRLGRAIDERRLANATLRARLPPEPEEIAEKRRAHAAALESEKVYQRQRAAAERKYQVVLTQTEELFRAAAVRVASRFTRFANAFLEEDCSLSFRLTEDRPSQSGARFMYPSLKFEMGAATFETRPLRESPDDVSESQREFVDLAFRMALMEAASDDAASTLVIETPEASLDAVFMEKAGGMLRTFAEGERRVIITSNLTSSVMIPSMLGGPTDEPQEIEARWTRILNLLDIAAPNAAVKRFRSRYNTFLDAGVRGRLS